VSEKNTIIECRGSGGSGEDPYLTLWERATYTLPHSKGCLGKWGSAFCNLLGETDLRLPPLGAPL